MESETNKGLLETRDLVYHLVGLLRQGTGSSPSVSPAAFEAVGGRG